MNWPALVIAVAGWLGCIASFLCGAGWGRATLLARLAEDAATRFEEMQP